MSESGVWAELGYSNLDEYVSRLTTSSPAYQSQVEALGSDLLEQELKNKVAVVSVDAPLLRQEGVLKQVVAALREWEVGQQAPDVLTFWLEEMRIVDEHGEVIG